MRVPGIGHFSPIDAVSWVRATSPSELAYRQRTKRPADTSKRFAPSTQQTPGGEFGGNFCDQVPVPRSQVKRTKPCGIPSWPA